MKKTKELLLAISLLFITGVFLQGCAIGFGLGLEATAIGDVALGEGIVGSAAEATTLASVVEAEEGATILTSGDVNAAFEKIRIYPGEYGSNAKLFVEGKPAPFAEVLGDSREVRFYRTGETIEVNKNIFAVKGEEVNVRFTPQVNEFNKVGQVHKNDMVFVLEETDNNWYRVQVVQNDVVKEGYISASLLTPVILTGSLHHATATNVSPASAQTVAQPAVKDTAYPQTNYSSNYGKVVYTEANQPAGDDDNAYIGEIQPDMNYTVNTIIVDPGLGYAAGAATVYVPVVQPTPPVTVRAVRGRRQANDNAVHVVNAHAGHVVNRPGVVQPVKSRNVFHQVTVRPQPAPRLPNTQRAIIYSHPVVYSTRTTSYHR